MRRFLFFCAVFRGAWGCRPTEAHSAFTRKGARDVLRFSLVAICISKQVCGNLLARRAYSAHKGVFYRQLPLIITRSPRRDALGDGPFSRGRAFAARLSPFAFRCRCRRRCRFGRLKERRRPFRPSAHPPSAHRPSLPTSRSCLFAFWSLRPSEKVGGSCRMCCVKVTGSQWEPACAAASSVCASLHA